MITLNRSTRDVGEFLQCGVTSEKVGPGSYSAASHGDASSNVKGSLAPFYSLQQKVLNRNTATSALTPGPGTYVVPETLDSERDRRSPFTSKQPRFAPFAPGSTEFMFASSYRNPGPGTYSPRLSDDVCQSGNIAEKSRRKAEPLLQMVKSTPTIPANLMRKTNYPGSGGQHLMALTDQQVSFDPGAFHTGEKQDAVGPGEYTVKIALTRPCIPSFDFHSSKSVRELWAQFAISTTGVCAGNVNYHSALLGRQLRAPPSYLLPDLTKPSRETRPTRGRRRSDASDDEEKQGPQRSRGSTESYAFKSGVKRLSLPNTVGPGPGAYTSPDMLDTAQISARNDFQFGSVVERQTAEWTRRSAAEPYSDPTHLQTPGPGSYYADYNRGCSSENMEQLLRQSSHQAPPLSSRSGDGGLGLNSRSRAFTPAVL
eukprot:GHVQ01027047.1.p1 GENE.GHVQ01027047.1~~GHVQ01027047.1.p1  ORF type:complete len:427 (+),score=17.38 GHVQ01027047.1:486-1766(+)